MIFVFTLFHGQNQVEYGFSINNDLLVENLKAESICAKAESVCAQRVV